MPFAVDILRVDFAVEALIEGASDFLLGFDSHALLQPPFDNLLLGHGAMLLVGAPGPDGRVRFTPGEQAVPVLRYTPDSYSAHGRTADATASVCGSTGVRGLTV
ncbi:hypothetical protein NMD87_02380 [Edwardsiella tarda]